LTQQGAVKVIAEQLLSEAEKTKTLKITKPNKDTKPHNNKAPKSC